MRTEEWLFHVTLAGRVRLPPLRRWGSAAQQRWPGCRSVIRLTRRRVTTPSRSPTVCRLTSEPLTSPDKVGTSQLNFCNLESTHFIDQYFHFCYFVAKSSHLLIVFLYFMFVFSLSYNNTFGSIWKGKSVVMRVFHFLQRTPMPMRSTWDLSK